MKGRAIDSRVFQLSSHRSCTTYSNNTFRAAEVRASLGPATRVGLTRHARLARGARGGARRARLRRRRGLRRGRRAARPDRALRLRGRVRYERPFHGAARPSWRPFLRRLLLPHFLRPIPAGVRRSRASPTATGARASSRPRASSRAPRGSAPNTSPSPPTSPGPRRGKPTRIEPCPTTIATRFPSSSHPR